MKTPRQTSKLYWQTERIKVLHRACLSLQGAIDRGHPIGRVIRRTARRLNGRLYKSDPNRKVALSAQSLRRIWDVWRRGGKVPSALRLQYATSGRKLYAPILVCFVNLCARREFRTYKAAWQTFCAQSGKRTYRPNYDTLHRALPAGCFKAFQAQWKAIRQAEITIARNKLRFTAQIRSTVPDRPPRHRNKRVNEFQI